MERPQSSPIGVPRHQRPAPTADVPPRAESDVVTQPPTKQAKPRPPPQPNLMHSKKSVAFSLPPNHRPRGPPSTPTAIRRSPKTIYVLTPAQGAMMAGLADGAPWGQAAEGDTFSNLPPPLTADIPQGKPCSLMQPQPQVDAHPFTPVMKKW